MAKPKRDEGTDVATGEPTIGVQLAERFGAELVQEDELTVTLKNQYTALAVNIENGYEAAEETFARYGF